MKIRQGFVSNSSSSSFVIAYKDDKPCSHCGRSDPDIIHMVETSGDRDYGETGVAAVGTDAVVEEIKAWFGIGMDWANESNQAAFTNTVANISDAIDNGYKVAAINVSYHNDILNGILENEKNESIKILWSGDG